MSRVAKQIDGCWIWQGPPSKNGYGYVSRTIDGVKRKHGVHRLAWMSVNGPLPTETPYVLHHCDVKLCVNPEHLYAGTHAQNMADRDRRNRTTRGEAKPEAKLTAEIVREARKLHAAGHTSQSLAERHGVSKPTMWKAITAHTWRSVR